jgi:hypothetical protein
MLRPAASGEGVVQFSRLLSESEFRRLADWLAAYPRMTLHVYGSSEIAISGSFASSRRCGASNAMRSTSSKQRQVCITCLPSSSCSRLARQGVSSTSRSIARFRDLKKLYLERQTRKIEAAGGVQNRPDLSGASALRRIHLETIKEVRDLRPLTSAPVLER